MRSRTLLVTSAVALAGAALVAVSVPGSPLSAYAPHRLLGDEGDRAGAVQPPPTPAETVPAVPTPTPGASPTTAGPFRLTPTAVTVSSPGFWSWVLLDTRTGALAGSPNIAAPSDTASMSKAWVAADYLRRAAERKQTPNAEIMRRLSTMIRDSDTTHTFAFHVANGNLASIRRMIALCRLTDTIGVPNSWSLTRMSARDATRLGACIADGRAAGPRWTSWLLGEMRAVRGPGRFGVIEIAPPAAQVAAKNGWLLRDDKQWHIACMAVGDGWALGVMARHAGHLGKDHGAGICRQVAEQLHSP